MSEAVARHDSASLHWLRLCYIMSIIKGTMHAGEKLFINFHSLADMRTIAV